ncbi:MAG TPA: MarR family transcriptional regulator [Gaiellaceae bacterium]|nr:MarR family transcriptional regulator [Gaiellaceae bacterium]
MSSRSPDTAAILSRVGKLVRELTRQVGGADDGPAMTATQRIALVELGEDSPLRLNDLAHRMGTSAPTASRAVDVLEGLGLARRAPEPGDRRALSIALTAEGRALFDGRFAQAAVAFAPATASLSADERRTLIGLLEQMTTALRDGGDA